MSQHPIDRNLLVALLALQMGLLTRSSFLQLVREWIEDRSQPIEQLIRRQRLLDEPTLDLLLALMKKHLELHGGSVERSLKSASSKEDVRDELQEIPSQDLEATIAFLKPKSSSPSSYPANDETDATQPAGFGATGASQRFRVLRFHAEGGLGRVSVAHDAELNRDVALKEIKPRFGDDEASRVRFVAEAEITGALEHPGIVPVYSLGQYADGRPFYAMRFIRGDSLKKSIAEMHQRDRKGWPPGERQLELRRLLARFIDVCEAVAYAHSRGVLHRDLKPGNIMLGRYGETLVVDWGLAKPVGRIGEPSNADEATVVPRSGDSSRTQAGTLVGTMGYVSPEQAQGRLDLLGPATDVYSLGATLYTILAGQPTFVAVDQESFTARVVAGDFPPPSKIKPNSVPPALEAICLKALATRCEDRYENAKALAEDIERWLGDEPVSAYREPWPDRLARTIRNHRTKFAAAAAVAGSAAFALLVILVLVSRQNHALRIARDEAYQQYQVAQREQRRAEANLEVARTWATRLLRFAENTARLPGLGAIRRGLTDECVSALQELARVQTPDSELEMQLANALRTWAMLTWGEDLQRSIKANQEATDILRRRIVREPKSVVTRNELALALQDQANLLKRAGNFPDTEARFKEALNIAIELPRNSQDPILPWLTEATVRVAYSAFLLQTGETNEAAAHSVAAVGLLRKPALGPSAPTGAPELLALAMLTEIEALRMSRQAERAETAIRDAITMLASLPESQDTNFDYVAVRIRLEQCLLLREDATRIREAEEAADLGLSEGEALLAKAKDSPRITVYRTLYARMLAHRGMLHARANSHEPARRQIDEALAICESLAATPTTAIREAHAEVLWLAAQAAQLRGEDAEFQRLRSRAIERQRELVKDIPLHVPARELLEQMEKS